MTILQFIIFIFIWIISEFLIIKFEIKFNKELFYDLHKNEIERELKKND